ncbi:MAG: DUF6931 family protein [Janthinobacterium lividum]
MTAWNAVKLTEARQVVARMGAAPEALPDAAVSVRAGYDDLRAAGTLAEAVEYLSHALPRAEAVAWAAALIAEEAARIDLPFRNRQALDSALRWLDAPSDANRRSARAAADLAPRVSPERYLGLAVFYSGGSMAAADAPAVPPPDHACARFAVGAIEQAAYRSPPADRLFLRALALGEDVAVRGLAALDPS